MSLDAARMGYWEYDIEEGRVFWSPEMLRLFAVSTFDGDPKTIQSFSHAADREKLTAAFEAAVTDRTPLEAEFRVMRGDGQERWLANVGRCEYSPAGQPRAMRGVALDITDRKLGEITAAQMAAVVQNSGEAIVGMTPDGIVTQWNPAAERLFGSSAEESIGHEIDGHHGADAQTAFDT
jgi:PAS domain S-box-containing protein